MNTTFDRLRRILILALCAAAGWPGPAEATEANRASAPRAVELFDAGNCEEALPLLEQLVVSDTATGALWYRLYACQVEAGNPDARQSMTRARSALEAELESSSDLEVSYFLAAIYRDVGRNTAAKEVAAMATGRIESGTWAEPDDSRGRFRLGKLYADQDDEAGAVRWYGRALETDPSAGDPEARQAARYLADRAFREKDLESAAGYYRLLAESDEISIVELDRLAVALVRAHDYEGAQQAWHRALLKSPATGDRARYCGRLVFQAVELGVMPENAPNGRPWSSLDPAELEQILSDSAMQATGVIESAKAEAPLSVDRWNELQDQVLDHRRNFIASALEYVVRGLPIRETAFQGGYAPMIFHGRRWQVPYPQDDSSGPSS